MRIVSQKRDLSIDFDSTVISRNDNCIRARVGDRDVAIGIYESSNIASAIFKDIHKAYSPAPLVVDNMTDEEVMAFIGSKNTPCTAVRFVRPDQTISTFESVYYMPEV